MIAYDKARKEIEKALRAMDRAACILRDSPEYENKTDVFHAVTVADYNAIITAAEILNKI